MQTASKPHYNSERDKTATVPQQPRVTWQARNPLAGSRQKPVELFPLSQAYPFDLPWEVA